MDDRLRQILETLPEKPPRSRLEPFREFIGKLREQGRAYRDIAVILAETCELHISATAVHNFVRSRSLAKPEPRTPRTRENCPAKSRSTEHRQTSVKANDALHDVQQRIQALKHRSEATQPAPKGFQFDPEKPLRLKKSGGKGDDG
jgi:hypothetical protein